MYFDDMKVPALRVHELKNCCDAGTIGLVGHNGGAFYSGFKVTPAEDMKPLDIKVTQPANGIMVKEWMVSQVSSQDNAKKSMSPRSQNLKLDWNKWTTDLDGILNVTKHLISNNDIKDRVVYAKTIVISETDQRKRLSLGYTDDIEVFLNDAILFQGKGSAHNRYEGTLYRDNNEGIFLNLKKGRNELVVAISDSDDGFGGNGIQVALDDVSGIRFEPK